MIQIISKGLAKGLSQWDVGRLVQVTGDATHVHFANQGDSKAPIIDIVEGQAKIPDYLLQSGKALYAYAVLDGVTLESVSFPVKKKERPENYVYEDDRRNYIYELISNAENAIEASEAAVVNANDAAAKADEATASATDAAGNANNAAANANIAADKAVRAAGTFLVVGTASGERMVLTDAAEQYLIGCRIFGKSTQDGVPTPDAPVDLVNIGDSGSITVNVIGKDDAQSMTIATPNGLPGIPVASGGNYTDANGQQWICDEVDLARGLYIQRTVAVNDFTVMRTLAVCDGYYARASVDTLGPGEYPFALCSHTNIYAYNTNDTTHYYVDGYDLWVFVPRGTDVTGLEMRVILKTPIETLLSEEELAAYAALHTYRGNTTVSNDASAHMEIEYVMDAKKYIDSLVAGPAARLAWVTLEASAWKGENSLYSQVVTIDGVTPYSKVDLLPSVEQLAIFHNKDVAFVTENDDGVVTVYAIGDKPVLDYTMQAQITEVVV